MYGVCVACFLATSFRTVNCTCVHTSRGSGSLCGVTDCCARFALSIGGSGGLKLTLVVAALRVHPDRYGMPFEEVLRNAAGEGRGS